MEPGRLQQLVDLAREAAGEIETHTLDSALERWMSARCVPGLLKPRTLSAYKRASIVVSDRWGALDVRETDWRREAAEHYAAKGRSALLDLEILRFTLVHAQRLGWRSEPHNVDRVIAKCKYPPRETCYTSEQIAKILWSLDELDKTEPLTTPAREVIRALAFTGCRAGEIASLTRDMVGDGWIRRDTKTGYRTIPVCDEAMQVIRRQPNRSAFVFPGQYLRNHVSTRHCLSVFREARKLAGIREGSLHTLRHSWCTIAMRSGVPQAVIQKIMGHSSAWITSRYVHATAHDTRVGAAVVANAIALGRSK
jgi:integrase